MKSEEKEILLKEVDELLISKDYNITLSLVLSVTAAILVVLFLFIPKVYLSNNIYKTSIKIEKLKKEYLSLKNENEILKNKIVILKYKNGVSH